MRRGQGQEAFVLFSVIWIAGLLAVIASTFAVGVRLHVKGEANLSGSAEAETAADGFVRLLAYRLSIAPSERSAENLPTDGKVMSCDLVPGRRALFAIQDEGGLVDLNRASTRTLAEIVERAGNAQGRGEDIAEAIADFRDADSIRGALGGGPEESLVKDGPGPKNAPFQSVDEIEQAIPAGMAGLEALKPLFTVYSGQEGIDPASAPDRLKALVDAGSTADPAIPLVSSQRKAFSLDVEIAGKDGSTFRRTAIIAVLREPLRPFAVLEWRQGSGPLGGETAGEPPSRPCDDLDFS